MGRCSALAAFGDSWEAAVEAIGGMVSVEAA